ncbi:uncharacterized protein EHS24_003333 [Apiotrichum porosum]|uniref:Uncharacterized protein n=1 Tax=Apiotrichum porosum TaxID=105984 RepID=A0A427XF48_9TREE|nr:uncharacterized protein EHS24_003333 [Apiotrichum porosum]RSH77373.1 hypothetical protein EHS24_003333 [Apiotrichum porosum]
MSEPPFEVTDHKALDDSANKDGEQPRRHTTLWPFSDLAPPTNSLWPTTWSVRLRRLAQGATSISISISRPSTATPVTSPPTSTLTSSIPEKVDQKVRISRRVTRLRPESQKHWPVFITFY